MIAGIDHVVFGVRDLEAGVQRFEDELGLTVSAGGTHPATGTRNALVRTASGYLELITADDPASGLAGVLREREGLIGFAFATDDIDADAARLGAAGFPVLGPMALTRDRADGIVIRWRGLLIGSSLDDLWASALPFLIEWDDPATNAFGPDPMPLHRLGEVRIAGVTLATADVSEAHRAFEAGFGVRAQDVGVSLVPATSREGVIAVDLAVHHPDRGTNEVVTLSG